MIKKKKAMASFLPQVPKRRKGQKNPGMYFKWIDY